MVTDVGLNNDILTLIFCKRFREFHWTGVFSRYMNVSSDVLRLVNDRLRDAGLQNVDSAVSVKEKGLSDARGYFIRKGYASGHSQH
jgi:hypothetical protein